MLSFLEGISIDKCIFFIFHFFLHFSELSFPPLPLAASFAPYYFPRFSENVLFSVSRANASLMYTLSSLRLPHPLASSLRTHLLRSSDFLYFSVVCVCLCIRVHLHMRVCERCVCVKGVCVCTLPLTLPFSVAENGLWQNSQENCWGSLALHAVSALTLSLSPSLSLPFLSSELKANSSFSLSPPFIILSLFPHLPLRSLSLLYFLPLLSSLSPSLSPLSFLPLLSLHSIISPLAGSTS